VAVVDMETHPQEQKAVAMAVMGLTLQRVLYLLVERAQLLQVPQQQAVVVLE
jgi:hypothetical protein